MRGDKKQTRIEHCKIHGDRSCAFKGRTNRITRMGRTMEQAIHTPNTGHGGTLYRGVLKGTKKKYTIKEGGRKKLLSLLKMMRKQLIYHNKSNNKLFDYYSEDDDRETTYTLKVDGVTVYKGNLPLTDIDIDGFMKQYGSL